MIIILTTGQTLFFGPHSHRMPLVVHGSFKVITLNLAAGAATALGGPSCADTIDRILDYDELVGHEVSSRFAAHESPGGWLNTAEQIIRRIVASRGAPPPDPLTRAFEAASLADPNLVIADSRLRARSRRAR